MSFIMQVNHLGVKEKGKAYSVPPDKLFAYPTLSVNVIRTSFNQRKYFYQQSPLQTWHSST